MSRGGGGGGGDCGGEDIGSATAAAAAAAAIKAAAAVMEDDSAPLPGTMYTFDQDSGMLLCAAAHSGAATGPAAGAAATAAASWAAAGAGGATLHSSSGAGGGAGHMRRFVEDWRTGNFYPDRASGAAGGACCFGCCRLGAAPDADGAWPGGGAAAAAAAPGAWLLRGAAAFGAAAARWCAAAGAFAQGLAGGLALVGVFQTYLLAAASGQRAFLSCYAPIALQANRAFLALTSAALVAASGRLAFGALEGAARRPRAPRCATL